MVIASMHVADLGAFRTLRSTARRLDRQGIKGLRWGSTVLVMPLANSTPPSLRRAGLIAFWDGPDALKAFLAGNEMGRRFSEGFGAWLRPLRAHGAWDGFPADVPTTRKVAHDGPVVVLTMSRLHTSQLGRFLRTSRPAEKAAVADHGMLWGVASMRLPVAATMSVWKDTASVVSYAFDRSRPEHPHTIAEQQRKSFSQASLFARFAPVRLTGSLGQPDPIDAADIVGTGGVTSQASA